MKKKMKNENMKIILISFSMLLLFAFPLKSLCKLTLQNTFISNNISIAILTFISGIISYIVAKVHQYIKGKDNVVNFKEFIYIFTVSMVITIFFILLGYPLLAFFISGGVDSLVKELAILYEQLKVNTRGYKNITGYLMSDSQGGGQNTTGGLSDQNSPGSAGSSSSSVRDGLMESLSMIEDK